MAKRNPATGGDRPNTHIDNQGDSADRRAHGAHGKGGAQEKRQDETIPQADGSNTENMEPGADRSAAPRGEGARGSAGWGNAASGGSVIDKRSPEE